MPEPLLYPRPLQTTVLRRSGAYRDRFELTVTRGTATAGRPQLTAAAALWRRVLSRPAGTIAVELHHAGVCVARLQVPDDGTPLHWRGEHAGAWLEPSAFALMAADAALALHGRLRIEARAECPAEQMASALWPSAPEAQAAWMPDHRDVLALRQVVLRCSS